MDDGVDERLLVDEMNIPDRIVTLSELRRNTGERGTRKFISYRGVVYDVTDCSKWHGDLHENLHFPGQDLSSELEEAPHMEDVFARPCIKIVGRLED
jgi:predicted heme/steroid binding protein